MLNFERVGWTTGAARVLERVDLAVRGGEIVALVGPSGVGKTTVLRLAAGLLTPTSGAVVNRASRTAMVFQEPRLLPWESALDNAALPLETLRLSRAEARKRAAHWLERLALAPTDLSKQPSELSGGMKARVAVARAFVAEPDLVLMDEPFANLDRALRADLQDLTRRLVDETGVGVLFVTHDLFETARLADRVVALAGRPASVGADLRRKPTRLVRDLWRDASRLAVETGLDGIGTEAAPSPGPSDRGETATR